VSLDKRSVGRVKVNLPTMVQVIGHPDTGSLHPSLAAVFERVEGPSANDGERMPGVVRDLSSNGAFIAGNPLPLLSRVGFRFPLTGFGTVDVVAWVLWRRTGDCIIPTADGSELELPKGFGVLFEAIPLDARAAIHKVVASAG